MFCWVLSFPPRPTSLRTRQDRVAMPQTPRLDPDPQKVVWRSRLISSNKTRSESQTTVIQEYHFPQDFCGLFSTSNQRKIGLPRRKAWLCPRGFICSQQAVCVLVSVAPPQLLNRLTEGIMSALRAASYALLLTQRPASAPGKHTNTSPRRQVSGRPLRAYCCWAGRQ